MAQALYVPRRDLSNLEVGAGGDIRVSTSPLLSELREPSQLHRSYLTRRNPAAQHERILRRCHIKQAVVPKAECFLFIRKLVLVGVRDQPLSQTSRPCCSSFQSSCSQRSETGVPYTVSSAEPPPPLRR